MNNNHLVNIVAHSEPYRRVVPQSDPRGIDPFDKS